MDRDRQLFEGVFRRASEARLILVDGRLLDCNEAAVALFGYADPAALLAVEPAALSGAFAAAQPEERGSYGPGEWLCRRPDGTGFPAEIALTDFTLDGRPARVATIRDISERRRTEQMLKASERNLNQILDALPGRIAWIGRDRRHLYVNRQYCEFLGRPVEQVLGRTVEELIGGESWQRLKPFGEAALRGEATHWEGWMTYPDRGERYVYRTYAPRFRPDGGVDGYFIYVIDLTEQKRAEVDLAQQRESAHQNEKLAALGSLLAGVAHELNNPLAVVMAQAVMLMETSDDGRTVARGEKIHAAAERCARIVKSFLAIARQRPTARAAVDLLQVVRAAIELTSYGLRSSGIEIELDMPFDLPPVDGDADRLAQVAMNLILNAQHALEDHDGVRLLRIVGRDEGATVRLSVVDSGPGIPPDIRTRIFDPFFTTKTVGAGTGIGLSLCLGIVQSHGGTLSLDDMPGWGACFSVRLRKSASVPAERGAVLAGPMRVETRGDLLIVDDEEEVAETLAEILAPLADRVDRAVNGNDALRLIAQRDYGAIVSDLRMPGLDGPGLFRELRRLGNEKAIGGMLFVTGATLGPALEKFLRDTGRPVLEKPFSPAEVKRVVGDILRARRA